MKRLNYKHISVLCCTLFGISSCELTSDLDEYQPSYALTAEESIKDENTAELALIGAYAGFRRITTSGTIQEALVIPDYLSGYAQHSTRSVPSLEREGWIKNEPIASEGSINLNAYTHIYNIINRANWIIEKVNQMSDNDFKTEGRRTAIIGEAKIIRAIGHFNLLRLYGQFYDQNSVYGINLRLAPVKSADAYPRNTVAESYASIIQDLDDGIQDAPDYRARFFSNKTFAKGYKAKVLLYKGDYSSAATVAKEVMNQTNVNFKLGTNFANIFNHSSTTILFTNNTEVLFGIKGESTANLGISNVYNGNFATVSQSYINATSESMQVGSQTINFDGTRVSSMFPANTFHGGYRIYKYQYSTATGTNEMLYLLRMAEVNLIYAEANARSTNSVSATALAALNAVRLRSGATTTGNGFVTYPETITYNQFLEAIRMEKLVELQGESGESWFDLVRYDYADGFGAGFKVSDTKATATNKDKFILPIPYETIIRGGNIIIQNPSYSF